MNLIAIFIGFICGVVVYFIGERSRKTKGQSYDTTPLQEEKLKLEKEIANLETELKIKEQQQDEMLRYQSNLMKDQLKKDFNSFAEKLQQQKEDLEFEKNNFIENLEVQKLQCQKELDGLRAMRNSIVEANKREEEVKRKQDFYRIVLDENAHLDMERLVEFSKTLCRPQIVYKLIWTEYVQGPFKELWGRVGKTTKVCGIYKITNLKSQKSYIGQSTDIKERWTSHIKASLGIDTIAHQKIHGEIAREGLENFTFEILQECEKSELNSLEKHYIKLYQTDSFGFNETKGGS